MQTRRAKIFMLAILAIFVFFFSNDFGLIDVEKTSIITGIAIDLDESDNNYVVTAQIAVPEATDTNSENTKAQLSGKGQTIGAAIKNLGDISGWFPKLSFCNMIVISNDFENTCVLDILDYFAKTLRVQDSALVAMSENSAKELLQIASPLDNISSFALQKVLLKNPGFDRDVATTNIKTFCAGCYSKSGSSYMPLIKILLSDDGKSSDEDGNQSGNNSSETGLDSGSGGGTGGQETKTKSNYLFDAKTTVLFKNGYKVGQLEPEQTLTFNALLHSISGTSINVENVSTGISDNLANYLLTVMNSKPKLKLKATDNDLTLSVKLDIYCKIADVNTAGSDYALSKNQPLPIEVKEKTQEILTKNIEELIKTSIQTECDFLNLKEKLYRHNYKQYSRYKDNYFKVVKSDIMVSVSGQK